MEESLNKSDPYLIRENIDYKVAKRVMMMNSFSIEFISGKNQYLLDSYQVRTLMSSVIG